MNRRELMASVVAGLSDLSFAELATAQPSPIAVQSNFGLKKAYLDTPYGQVYYWTAGSGPNLVLVHQSGNSSLEYEGLVPFLADKFHCIAVDLPGHGRSDDPTSEPTVDDYAAAIKLVLDHLAVKKAHVVGHHGGALAAMSLVANAPERFEKTILSGTGAARSPEENAGFLQMLVESHKPVTNDPQFMATLWQEYLDMMSDDADVMDILKPYVATLEARQRPYRGIVVNLKWDRREAVSKLRGPVLLVQGDKDIYVTGQESLLQIIPNSRRIVMKGCNTFMFYDRPKDCARMISDFLSEET